MVKINLMLLVRMVLRTEHYIVEMKDLSMDNIIEV